LGAQATQNCHQVEMSFGVYSGGCVSGLKQRMQGDVFEEVDLDTNGDDLAEFGGGEVFAAGAEVGEAQVAGTGEFETAGDERGVEVEGGAELDFDAELHGAGRKGLAAQDPAAAVGKGRGEGGEEIAALFVAEALNIERMHYAS
jgi:hypothetical protein